MQDATHLRYPTALTEVPPPLAVAAFPAPRGGFGPLTVSSSAAFDRLRHADWAEHAAPVLVAPSKEGAAAVATAAGDVWDKLVRAAVVVGGTGGKGTVSGMVGGMVGISGVGGVMGNGAAAGAASKACVTLVLKRGGYIRWVVLSACVCVRARVCV